MAKKESKAIDYFKEIMFNRYGISSFIHENGIMYSLTNGVTILTIPEQILWDEIIEDEELKSMMTPLNPEDSNFKLVQEMMRYADDIDGNSWFGLDADKLFNNNVINIDVLTYGYSVPISRGLFPKMRKAEYSQFSYRIFLEPRTVLALKKKWKAPTTCFTTIRPFLLV